MTGSPASELPIMANSCWGWSRYWCRQARQINDESSTDCARLDSNAPAVSDHQAANHRQSNSAARDGRVRITREALEGLPDRAAVLRWNPRSLVVYRDARECAVRRDGD